MYPLLNDHFLDNDVRKCKQDNFQNKRLTRRNLNMNCKESRSFFSYNNQNDCKIYFLNASFKI